MSDTLTTDALVKILKPLEELIAKQADEIRTLKNEYTEEIRKLRNEIDSSRPRNPLPSIVLTPSSSRATSYDSFDPPQLPEQDKPDQRLSEKLPDPPVFTGKRRELPGFLSKLKYKLEGNADRYPTARLRFLYAHSLLGGDAATLVRPLLDRDITTVEELVSFLVATYEDPNRKDTATARLLNLKQGKQGFLAHFAEFRRLAADTDLNEAGLIVQLKRSLSTDLLRAMIGVKVPNTLNEYANLIVSYDNDLRYLPKQPRAHLPGPITPTRDPDAMEIDNIHQGYAPKGSPERAYRIQRGLCFKFGSDKHLSPGCSEPMPTARTAIRNTSVCPQPGDRSQSRGRHPSRRPSHSSSTCSSESPKASSRQ